MQLYTAVMQYGRQFKIMAVS
uniref:Uncharacterized protein n=1 Tax=Moniliophthora roreri TaxID=221103 RepID=A0A0W0G1V8_MONRR